jgi:type IV pilus assembly protein PilN
MLDEIARLLPEAVILKSLKQQGEQISLEGEADTNARVAALIANLSASSVLVSPQLVQISTLSKDGQRKSAFTLTVKFKLATPAPDTSGSARSQLPGGKK